jgi:hypothetical protein
MKGQIDCAFRVPFVAAPVHALGSCAGRLILSQAGGERLRRGNLALSMRGLDWSYVSLRVGPRVEGRRDPNQTALRQIRLVRWLLVVCNAVDADARLMHE